MCIQRNPGEDLVEAEIRVGIRGPLELDPFWSTRAHVFKPDWSKPEFCEGEIPEEGPIEQYHIYPTCGQCGNRRRSDICHPDKESLLEFQADKTLAEVVVEQRANSWLANSGDDHIMMLIASKKAEETELAALIARKAAAIARSWDKAWHLVRSLYLNKPGDLDPYDEQPPWARKYIDEKRLKRQQEGPLTTEQVKVVRQRLIKRDHSLTGLTLDFFVSRVKDFMSPEDAATIGFNDPDPEAVNR
jgi:hypothetical protein